MFIDLGILFSVRKITRDHQLLHMPLTPFFKKDIVANHHGVKSFG